MISLVRQVKHQLELILYPHFTAYLQGITAPFQYAAGWSGEIAQIDRQRSDSFIYFRGKSKYWTSKDAIFYLSVLYASASSSAVHQFLCAYTGSALSEFFVLVGELPSFLMLDDLSRHAMAYREIYLLLRRPPGREAYPGEIFFVHLSFRKES